MSYASKLKDLESFTSVIELKTGESLYANGDGPIDETERGLFFIEHGLMVRNENYIFHLHLQTVNSSKLFVVIIYFLQ